ncbi:hypothetical protein pdam_00023353 [Pocillopora damicornis]|uniref:Uncharacterized protein n=1 Tax=Pocillopora damicornis TaxID=46731 RepID=A0A3M6T4U1_POCDA|nr:hypothetical protein pdam_00023353 [Pocillopora damicornis]
MLLRNNGDFLRQRGAPPAPVAFPKDYFFLDGMVLFLFSIACLWHAGFGEALSEVPFGASCVIDSEDSKKRSRTSGGKKERPDFWRLKTYVAPTTRNTVGPHNVKLLLRR